MMDVTLNDIRLGVRISASIFFLPFHDVFQFFEQKDSSSLGTTYWLHYPDSVRWVFLVLLHKNVILTLNTRLATGLESYRQYVGRRHVIHFVKILGQLSCLLVVLYDGIFASELIVIPEMAN